jgi:hypothetical protein
LIDQQRALSYIVNKPESNVLVPHHAVKVPAQPAPRSGRTEPRERPEGEPYWLCLGFVPMQPAASGVPMPGSGHAADQEQDLPRAVVLPLGDDAFLGSLPAVLRHSTATEVNNLAAEQLDLPAGRYFMVTVQGTAEANSGVALQPQAALLHPDCQTGHCAPRSLARCTCRCSVCLSLCRDQANRRRGPAGWRARGPRL